MIANAIRRRAATLALLLLAACSSATQNGSDRPAPVRERTTVQVRNNSFTAYTIYVLSSTDRRRLGDVPGTSTATFVIPPTFLMGTTQLRFQADPIGSSAVASTYTIPVREGDELTLTIQ